MAKTGKSQQTDVLVSRSGLDVPAQSSRPAAKIVTTRVPAAGILKVLTARVGQKVKAGQVLETVEKNKIKNKR